MLLTIGYGIDVAEARIVASPLFLDWVRRIGQNWQGTVTITDVGIRNDEIHTIQMAVRAEGNPFTERHVLRSETVDVLTIVTDGARRAVIFVEQFRTAMGANVVSNVAGGLEPGETVVEAMKRELRQELGIEPDGLDIDYLLLLPQPLSASPGVTNERTHMAEVLIHVEQDEFDGFVQQFDGKQTGEEDKGEFIVTRVQPAEQARRFIEEQSNPDAKTLLSLHMVDL